LVEIAEGRKDAVEMAGGQAFDQADDILQQEGNTDGGNQRHQARRATQGAIGHPFHRYRQGPGRRHP
jgi:hypothetical protein